ncbi:MAG: diacylglycerol kinase family protein [bacterium]
MRTKVVVNPNSANGRTGRTWDSIEGEIRKHLPEFDVGFTAAPRDATEIARRALHEGCELVVCVGGDGTISEVVNGFFEGGELINGRAELGIVCVGTGADFVKTLGIPRTMPEAAAVLGGGGVVRCDVGRIRCNRDDGSGMEHYFINIADFGIGGVVVDRVNRTTKVFGGFASFFIGMLRAAFSYRNQPVRIEVDGEVIGERVIKNVVVANGQYFGGGMRIAKEARLDDGLFEVIILGDLGMIEMLLILRRMYRGDIIGAGKVERYKARTVRAAAEGEVLLDVDGEQIGVLPASFEILPACIGVKVPDAK